MQFGSYSFLDVKASVSGPGGSFSLSDFELSDEGVTLAQTADKNTLTTGANGDGMHSMKASRAVRATVTLLKTGNGNAQLNAMYRYQAVSSARWGQNIITITNAVTGDSVTLTAGAFVRQTDLGYKTEGGVNVWAYDVIDSEQILGDAFATQSGV